MEEFINLCNEVLDGYKEIQDADYFYKNQLPSKKIIESIVEDFRILVFLYYCTEELGPDIMPHKCIAETLDRLSNNLRDQITISLCVQNGNATTNHQNNNSTDPKNMPQSKPKDTARKISFSLITALPEIRKMVALDVEAAFKGDPAAKSREEVILAYPCIESLFVYRIAHTLWKAGVPLIPRIMSEIVHGKTGIDIHPAAEIGSSFFIDHATGVVIGETTVIGNNVKIYQGVTIGALSVKKTSSNKKRHPTIEDDVTIYSGATILGGETVIGRGSIIGGNVWLTHSVPAHSKVYNKAPEYVIESLSNAKN